MLLYNTFHFFFSWTIHVSMHSAQEWHNLVCLPSGNCISSCASHYMKILRWSLCSHPYLFLNSSARLPLSVHSCHLCLNPFTLLKLSVFSHPIILGLSHSDFSVPILSFTLILLPPVHLLTTLPPYFHGSSPHDQWYEVITLPSVLLFPPTPPYTTTSLSSNLPPCFTARPPLYSCRHTCSCIRKLLICGGVDDF